MENSMNLCGPTRFLHDETRLSRRELLRATSLTAALALTQRLPEAWAGDTNQSSTQPAGHAAELKPRDAFQGIFEAMKQFPLVALCERHQLQEEHDFLTAMLFRPDLPAGLTDVVVEFGNAQYQDIADSYILKCKPVANARLEKIWRYTIGGGVVWDAPVYAQFFRTVRAVNWMRPASRRLRVLLGDPAFDHAKVKGQAEKPYVLSVAGDRDSHFAQVVEREVLAKDRRALLIAGSGHLLRGVKDDHTNQPNAVTLLDKTHHGKIFVIEPLFLPPAQAGKERSSREQSILKWSRPSLASLSGTWLGASPGPMAHRAVTPDSSLYAAQADAVLYLGAGENLTVSRADPALYQGGEYADELNRMKKVAAELGLTVNLDGLPAAKAGPRYLKD